MEEPRRKQMKHQAPEWVSAEACYFITSCLNSRGQNQLCLPDIGPTILKAIQHYHETARWYCHLAVLMPDHVHMLLNFPDLSSFPALIGNWKRWLAKQHGLLWQEDFFEHRLRKSEGVVSKSRYIMQNPVRAGLIGKCEDGPTTGYPVTIMIANEKIASVLKTIALGRCNI